MPTKPDTYCAFLDLLGFRSIIDDWDRAVPLYREAMTRLMPAFAEATESMLALGRGAVTEKSQVHAREEDRAAEARVRIISDSVIVTSESPMAVLTHACGLQNIAQIRGFWLRGGVGHGRHWEESAGGNLFVVSEALTRAYSVESTVAKHPRVAIHKAALPLLAKMLFQHDGDFMFPAEAGFLIQAEDDVWFVNPYHGILGAVLHNDSDMAAAITAKLSEHRASAYLDKYLWSACLHNFLVFPGHVAQHLKLYIEDAEGYVNTLKQVDPGMAKHIELVRSDLLEVLHASVPA